MMINHDHKEKLSASKVTMATVSFDTIHNTIDDDGRVSFESNVACLVKMWNVKAYEWHKHKDTSER